MHTTNGYCTRTLDVQLLAALPDPQFLTVHVALEDDGTTRIHIRTYRHTARKIDIYYYESHAIIKVGHLTL